MTRTLFTAALMAAVLALPAQADEIASPGSVLVYPVQHTGFSASSFGTFNIISITNTEFLTPIEVEMVYVTAIPDPSEPLIPLSCVITNRREFLTPADTLSVLTTCHNPTLGSGYLVAAAEDPLQFDTKIAFNHLVGSELVISPFGVAYVVNAYSFKAKRTGLTDCDENGQLDFDGIEYERIPDYLYVDSFTGLRDSALSMINMTGGTQFTARVAFDIFNDNEWAFSQTLRFRCWMEQRLEDISIFFNGQFLAFNTPNDPRELDLNCDNDDDAETGWFRISGLSADSVEESIMNPAILGSITHGRIGIQQGGKLLWGSDELQGNGDFFKTSSNDPEYPCAGGLDFSNVSFQAQGSRVLRVRGVVVNSGDSPVHDIMLSAAVPGATATLDIGFIRPNFDLGAGKSQRFAFEFVPPSGGSAAITLDARGALDIACGGTAVSGKTTVPLPAPDALPAKTR